MNQIPNKFQFKMSNGIRSPEVCFKGNFLIGPVINGPFDSGHAQNRRVSVFKKYFMEKTDFKNQFGSHPNCNYIFIEK